MARHRSPKGRRAHLGLPLSASLAAAGVGGGASVQITQLTTSLPARFVATALAGGVLAAAGQHILAEALPAATDGTNVLRLGVQELLGAPAEPAADLASPIASAIATEPAAVERVATIAPVEAVLVREPVVADATKLVKASDMQREAAEATARAAAAEKARVAQEEASAAAAAAAADEAARAAKRDRAARTESTAKPENDVPRAAPGGAVQIVSGGRFTSGFGGRWGTTHEGIDIAAPIGTPIRVPLAGTVIDSGPASGFGLWVRVQHRDGTITTYGHVNRSFVAKGQQVAAGQRIAEVGNRGQSTGPHLHLEVTTPAGQKINPRPWLDQRGIRV